jgi:hypothetical protein
VATARSAAAPRLPARASGSAARPSPPRAPATCAC